MSAFEEPQRCLSCERAVFPQKGYWLFQGRPRCNECAKVELRGIVGGPGRTIKIALAALVAVGGYAAFIGMFTLVAGAGYLAMGFVGLAFSALAVLNRTLDGDAEMRELVEVVRDGRRRTLYEWHANRRYAVWSVMLMSAIVGGWFFFTHVLEPQAAASTAPQVAVPAAPVPTASTTASERRHLEQAKRKLEEAPAARPDCYTGEASQMFVYTNDKGKDVIADTFSRVPLSQRATARCIVN